MILGMAIRPQIQKLRELAREAGCDQPEEAFDVATQTVSRHRPAKSQVDAPDAHPDQSGDCPRRSSPTR